MGCVSDQERDKDKQVMARILIIDDDVQFRSMLRQRLERAGYEVLEAPDGRVGMRVFREERVHLVITDIVMPEKEGSSSFTVSTIVLTCSPIA